jgi:hypothetical protein
LEPNEGTANDDVFEGGAGGGVVEPKEGAAYDDGAGGGVGVAKDEVPGRGGGGAANAGTDGE